ncbi:cold-regulated protein 27-like isoform X2 [Nymphaea colorata]|uniref:cold-regulated protein 27-like isoform X2 n=1 Tax=Nymphaea colorata TaxID=210225 RepID=UPI00129E3A51|nr:cold-regulated protein 27-like isoform X2 [Nymphaea colorata]
MGKGRTDSSSEAAKDLGGEPPPRSGVRPTMTEDSLVTDWTDEKHRLYINSMEASFVSQLHSQKHFSSSLLSWLQKKRKLQNQRPELMSTSTSGSTGQFEVLQEGSWKRLNFDDTEFQADVLGSQQDLLVNPWIRHFKSGSSSKGRRVTSAKLQGEYDGHIGELREVVPHSSKSHFTQTSNHLSHMSVQKYFGNNSEASDQNFSEEEGEENNFVKGIQMEEPESRNNEASAFDQVVPFNWLQNSGKGDESVAAKDGHTVDADS